MGNLSALLTNPTSQVDMVAALVTAVLLDEQASDTNLASNLAGGALGSVPIQSGPNTTTFVASPTTSGHKFLLGWTPSGSAIAPAAIDATSLGTLAAASTTNPIVDGTAAPGTAATYARGDHVHPTDTSRASAGANADLTSLSGLTTALSVAQGGTGVKTTAANKVLAGPTSGADAAPGFRALVAADLGPIIQTKRTTAYTLTSDDVAAGFVNIAVAWPTAFADASYSIAYSVIHSASTPTYDVAPADIPAASVTASGFTAGVYLNSGDAGLAGDTLIISAIGVHS